MRTAVLIPLCLLSLVTVSPVCTQSDNLTPLKERVNVQADSAVQIRLLMGVGWPSVQINPIPFSWIIPVLSKANLLIASS